MAEKEQEEQTEQAEAEPTDGDDLKIEVVDQVLLKPRAPASKFELRLSPYAWAKIRWIRDYCQSEIAGFGISSVDDPFYMSDFRTVKQVASTAHFEFDDDALNDYLASMFEEGKQPAECMRLWVHTHPGKNFASPSGVDEDTFSDAFGNADWAMMIIVDEGDHVYARLRVKSGASQLQMITPHAIDYQPPFKGVDEAAAEAWKQEADENISRASVVETPVYEFGRKTLPSRRHGHHAHHSQRFLESMGHMGYQGYPDTYGLRALSDHGGRSDDWDDIDMLIADEARVMEITTEKGGDGVLVLFHNMWAIYDADVTPKCHAGATIRDSRDIADVTPSRCGELTWETDPKSGVSTPTFESEVVDGFVQYFDGDPGEETAARADAVAAAEAEDVEELDIELVGEVEVGSD